MKNTGIEYSSAECTPVVLPEMEELLPPLRAEQLAVLEADLLKNGCYAPVIVNEELVIIECCNDPQQLRAIQRRIQSSMNGLDASSKKVRGRIRFLNRFSSFERRTG